MDFDFKVTTWERVKVSADKEKEVLEGIKSGKITCSSDIWNIDDNASIAVINDIAPEQMSKEDNNNNPTIEVLDSNGNNIYNN